MATETEFRPVVGEPTPGEWGFYYDAGRPYIYVQGVGVIAELGEFGPRLYRGEDFEEGPFDIQFPEAMANGLLMTAARELLAACEVLVEVIDCHCLTLDDLPFDDTDARTIPPCQWHKAKAAIAKARGTAVAS